MNSWRYEELRDCKAWEDEGLELSTTSNEAAKLYDSCLSQYVGWYDEPLMDGLEKTCQKMIEADPNFYLGHTFNFGLKLLSTTDTIHTNQELKDEYMSLKKMRINLNNPRESLHYKAIVEWAESKPSEACKIWEDLLLDYPTDIHALKMLHDTYFYLGDSRQLRDSVARVLPIWEQKRPPLTSYLYGFYAFGLVENNEFEKAKSYGTLGLLKNKLDGWSTHSMAHVYEMQGQTDAGIEFLEETKKDWERCNFLASHNYWHLALFHIENEEYDVAAEILEKQILSRATESKAMLDIIDSSSLIWRLNLLKPTILQDSQLEEVYELCKPYSIHHVTTFNDTHFMMAYTSVRTFDDDRKTLITNLYSPRSGIENGKFHPSFRNKILMAFEKFREENYKEVVSLLEPLRYQMVEIGGSNAQRDLFNIMLIISCLKSPSQRDHKLAKALINEREALKGKRTKLSQSFQNLANER